MKDDDDKDESKSPPRRLAPPRPSYSARTSALTNRVDEDDEELGGPSLGVRVPVQVCPEVPEGAVAGREEADGQSQQLPALDQHEGGRVLLALRGALGAAPLLRGRGELGRGGALVPRRTRGGVAQEQRLGGAQQQLL